MTNKEMFIGIVGQGVPKGEVKAAMFAFHNKWVGKTPHITKVENPNTFCGSCIQRVKANVWKLYHTDAYRWEYKELIFSGTLGLHNAPVYKLSQEVMKQTIIRRSN